MGMSKKAFGIFKIIIAGLIFFFAASQIVRSYTSAELQSTMTIVYKAILWTRLLAGFPIIFLLKEHSIKNLSNKETTDKQNIISIPARFNDEKKVPSKVSMSQKKDSVIEKLIDLRESKLITEDEFVQLRSKLILSDFLLGLFN